MSALYAPKGGTVGTESGELASAVVQPRQVTSGGGVSGGLLTLSPKIVQAVNAIDVNRKVQLAEAEAKRKKEKILGLPAGVFFVTATAVLVGVVWFVTRKR